MAQDKTDIVDPAIIEGILVDIDPKLDKPKKKTSVLKEVEALQPGLVGAKLRFEDI